MGDIADYYILQQINDDGKKDAEQAAINKKLIEAEKLEEKYNAGVLYWSTQHEGKIKVQLLKTSHLVNIEKFLGRKRDVNNPVSEMWLTILKREIIKRQSSR